MCAGNFVAEERKSGRKKLNLACGGLGFILHLSRRSSHHHPLEGAQLSAVPVLQGGVFTRPGPKRQLGSATDLRGFWVQPGVHCFLKVTLRLLSEGGDRESPALQDWDFRNPSEGFSFLVVSLCFRRALQGWIMTDSRASRTIFPAPQLPDPSKHICPYGSNRLEYLKPELQKIKNRCFPWSGQALCHGAPGSPCPLPVLLWVRVITLDLEF